MQPTQIADEDDDGKLEPAPFAFDSRCPGRMAGAGAKTEAAIRTANAQCASRAGKYLFINFVLGYQMRPALVFTLTFVGFTKIRAHENPAPKIPVASSPPDDVLRIDAAHGSCITSGCNLRRRGIGGVCTRWYMTGTGQKVLCYNRS